ncbi:MAG TPA: tetratricopeptide repeat protein, partial [candidate division Zixibacteria bacterium]
MKRGLGLFSLGFIFLGSVLCFSAQAQTWKELLDQADSLFRAASYDSAIVVGKLALEKAKEEFGEEDTTVASVLNRIGACYLQKADYIEAENILKQALTIREKVLGPEHPSVGKSLNNLANIYYDQAKYTEAEPLYKRALTIWEKTLGPEHPDVARVFHNLANIYSREGKYAEAESLYKRALAIREKAFGPEHPDVAANLGSLATLYGRQGKYAEIEPLLERALVISEKALGPGHPDVATYLFNMGLLRKIQGKYAEAESLYKRALAIRERAFGPEHPTVAMNLEVLATVYCWQAKYAEAEPLYRRALAINEKALGPEHPNVATTLGDLADLYCGQARYAEAEPLYKRSLAIWEKVLGPDDPELAIDLRGLGGLYCDQGKYTEAEPLIKRALAIDEEAFGPEHPAVAGDLAMLGYLYNSQGKYAEVEPLIKRALAMSEKVLGPDHPIVAGDLENLAYLYRKEGKYAEAESLYKEVLSIIEKVFGPEHFNVTSGLVGLANLYRDQGRYAEAESLYEQTLAMDEKTLTPYDPYMAYDLSDWALLLREAGRFTDSEAKEKRAYTIRRQNFRDNSSVLSERDALTYSKFMRDEANQYISILLDSKDTSLDCQKEIASVVFCTKGQVSDGIFARHKTEASFSDTSLKALADSLRYARFKLANLYVKGPDQEDVEGYKKKLQEASQNKERLEGELARRSVEFRKELELWDIDVTKASNSLPSNSILVEYLKYDRLKVKDQTEPHYLVIVLDREGRVYIRDLGPSQGIDSLVASYRAHFQEISKRGGFVFSKDLEDYKAIATKLYEKIWKPVQDKLGNSGLVFVAPDGELNLVSFAGLVDKDGKYLIEDYPLQYLASARDLVRLIDKVQPNKGLFALGDPDFDASAQVRLSSTPLYAQTQDSTISLYTLRNIRSGCEELNSITVLPLPGTKRELENISSAWKKKTKEQALVFLGANASEENFKLNASGKKVIH